LVVQFCSIAGPVPAITEYKEYLERTHYTLGQAGWEQFADFALSWAEARGEKPSVMAAG
jgi:hypothetical protein